eukprot:gene26916-26279_t
MALPRRCSPLHASMSRHTLRHTRNTFATWVSQLPTGTGGVLGEVPVQLRRPAGAAGHGDTDDPWYAYGTSGGLVV